MTTEDEQYIQSAKISNYQSIKDLTIEFAPGLTTIVGKSSTGKSAILRALHTLAFNTNSPQVRAGAKQLNVAAQLTDATVSVTRGKSLSTYAIGDEKYTKAGVSVPDVVQSVIGITEKDMHFNFQFDKPYLLAETGSTITAVLGKLTQANVLREAIREGARRAQQAKQFAAQRTSDAAQIKQRIEEEFVGLDEQEAIVQGVSAEMVGVEKKLSNSKKIFDALLIVDGVKTKAARVKAAQVDRPDQTEVIAAAEAKLQQAQQIESYQKVIETITNRARTALETQKQAEVAVEYAELNYAETLKQLDWCPTCGRKMVEEHNSH